jgi:hypothetical protein
MHPLSQPFIPLEPTVAVMRALRKDLFAVTSLDKSSDNVTVLESALH